MKDSFLTIKFDMQVYKLNKNKQINQSTKIVILMAYLFKKNIKSSEKTPLISFIYYCNQS